MMKHTPGPWKVYQEKPHYYSIGTDYAHDRGHDQNIVRDVRKEANARLMAAAPELLEALKALLDISDFATNSRVGEIHLHIMAVIRKAEGEVSQ